MIFYLNAIVRTVTLRARRVWVKTRMNSKALWLAYRIWRHNRRIRAFKTRVETYFVHAKADEAKMVADAMKKMQEANDSLNTEARQFKKVHADSGL